MADASTAMVPATTTPKEAIVYTSIQDVLHAVEQGKECLHLDLSQATVELKGDKLMPAPVRRAVLKELVYVLPHLPLQSLKLPRKLPVTHEAQTSKHTNNH